MATIDQKIAARILTLLDHTDLNEQINLHQLCQQAVGPYLSVAAICIPPAYVRSAKEWFGTKHLVNVASVVNFPNGALNKQRTLREIEYLVEANVDEIDVVFPHGALLGHQQELCLDFIEAVRRAAGNKIVKVILETGALKDPRWIRRAGEIALEGGADFLKTSTGVNHRGATMEDCAQLLQLLLERPSYGAGLKISGGVSTFEEAFNFVGLAIRMMGREWVTAENFRIGSSTLYNALIDEIAEA